MARGSVRAPRTSAELAHLAERRRKQLHDVLRPGSADVRIDRVLICPSGVHVVTHHFEAGRRPVDPAVVTASLESAEAVAALLPPRYRERVRPVLCRSEDEPVAQSVRGVLVTSSDTLEHVLRSSPVVLSTSEVVEVAARLEARLAPFPVEDMRKRRRWGWRRWSLAGAATAASAAASVAVFAPDLLRIPLP